MNKEFNFRFVNLTPQPIVYEKANGDRITFQPSGKIIKITYYRKFKETDTINNGIIIERFDRTIDQHFVIEAEIDPLPDPEPQTYFIVLPQILNELRKKNVKRFDIIAPATDHTKYRVILNTSGLVEAITTFIGLP